MISILIIVQAYKQIYSYRMFSKNKKSECYISFQAFFWKNKTKKTERIFTCFLPKEKIQSL